MSWCRWIVMSEAWQRPTHSAQDIDPTSRFVPALHHNLPEFVTFHSARRRIRNILKLRSSIATVGRRDPDVLPAGRGERSSLLAMIRQVANSDGALPQESKRRLARVETLFGEPKLKSLPSAPPETDRHNWIR
jgi:hypothetical protein